MKFTRIFFMLKISHLHSFRNSGISVKNRNFFQSGILLSILSMYHNLHADIIQRKSLIERLFSTQKSKANYKSKFKTLIQRVAKSISCITMNCCCFPDQDHVVQKNLLNITN